MPVQSVRPYYARPITGQETEADWMTPPPLVHGGIIARRLSQPMAGYWVIRDGTASGPFLSSKQARDWAVNGRMGR